jgi:hypothetical protein
MFRQTEGEENQSHPQPNENSIIIQNTCQPHVYSRIGQKSGRSETKAQEDDY